MYSQRQERCGTLKEKMDVLKLGEAKGLILQKEEDDDDDDGLFNKLGQKH
jgi:hypothetical protein